MGKRISRKPSDRPVHAGGDKSDEWGGNLAGEKLLAIAVLQQAVDEYLDKRITKCHLRGPAKYFLLGGPQSPLDFWCKVADISRVAMQERFFGK